MNPLCCVGLHSFLRPQLSPKTDEGPQATRHCVYRGSQPRCTHCRVEGRLSFFSGIFFVFVQPFYSETQIKALRGGNKEAIAGVGESGVNWGRGMADAAP